jgi:hypothetical protein
LELELELERESGRGPGSALGLEAVLELELELELELASASGAAVEAVSELASESAGTREQDLGYVRGPRLSSSSPRAQSTLESESRIRISEVSPSAF